MPLWEESIVSDLSEFQHQDEMAELKAAHQRALRTLAKREKATEELVEAVYRAAKDAALGMKIPPVPVPVPDKRKGRREVALVQLSDWQLGKKSADYDIDVAAKRIGLLAEKVKRVVEIQRKDHAVDEIVILLTGDLVESDGNIFPGQAFEVEPGGLYLQIFRGAEILAQFVRAMAALFPTVRVYGAIGNHGRLGRYSDHSPESNSDAILMNIARQLVSTEKRVTWKESLTMGGRHWYDTFDLPGGKLGMIVHGDQFRGGLGMPWYGVAKKASGWQLSVARFDYLWFGHWHQPARLVLADGKITTWCSPSLESSNRFAQEVVGASGEPGQWLQFFDGNGEVSAEYLIRLR
jgi:hypothetical protein